VRTAALRLLLVLAGLGLPVLLAELAVRGLEIGPRIEPIAAGMFRTSSDLALRYELRPGAPDMDGAISAAGLRERDLPQAKPPGTFRIAVIGDSVAFGLTLPARQAFPRRLEQRLAELAAVGAGGGAGAPRIEVLNFGVPGYNISQVAALLRTRVLDFEPDLVLYAYVLNDPLDYSFELEVLERAGEQRQSARSGLERWLLGSRLYRLARFVVFAPSQGAEPALQPAGGQRIIDPAFAARRAGRLEPFFRGLHVDEPGLSRLAKGLRELAQLSQARGLPLRVVIFPIFSKESGALGELADVHARVADAAQREGLEVDDLAGAYERSRSVLGLRIDHDFLHPNALGHRVAAVALAQILVREDALPLQATASQPDLAAHFRNRVDREIVGALGETGR